MRLSELIYEIFHSNLEAVRNDIDECVLALANREESDRMKINSKEGQFIKKNLDLTEESRR